MITIKHNLMMGSTIPSMIPFKGLGNLYGLIVDQRYVGKPANGEQRTRTT